MERLTYLPVILIPHTRCSWSWILNNSILYTLRRICFFVKNLYFVLTKIKYCSRTYLGCQKQGDQQVFKCIFRPPNQLIKRKHVIKYLKKCECYSAFSLLPISWSIGNTWSNIWKNVIFRSFSRLPISWLKGNTGQISEKMWMLAHFPYFQSADQ